MEKTISVLSSKGGVGKTTIAASLIDFLALKNFKITAVDADVNAPNLAKWYDNVLYWDGEKEVKIFPCPNKYKKCKDIKIICNGKELPVELEKRGRVYLKVKYKPSFAKYTINLVSGDILEGKTGSGKVVEETIKESAKFDYDFRIIDSAPGTGYPVLTCIKNSDYVVLVTEATSLGLKDLKKLIKIVEEKEVDYGVVINREDIDPDIAEETKRYIGSKYLGSLSYDKTINSALKKSLPPNRESLSAKKLEDINKRIFNKNTKMKIPENKSILKIDVTC